MCRRGIGALKCYLRLIFSFCCLTTISGAEQRLAHKEVSATGVTTLLKISDCVIRSTVVNASVLPWWPGCSDFSSLDTPSRGDCQCARWPHTFAAPFPTSSYVKLLLVRRLNESGGYVGFRVVDVPGALPSSSNRTTAVDEIGVGDSSFTPLPSKSASEDELAGIVYDGSADQRLYLIYLPSTAQQHGEPYAEVFSPIDGAFDARFVHLFGVHPVFANATNWSSDPENEAVHYQLRGGDGWTGLYSLSLLNLTQSLMSGSEGVLIAKLNNAMTSMRLLNGTIYGTSSGPNGHFLIDAADRSKRAFCPSIRSPCASDTLIVIGKQSGRTTNRNRSVVTPGPKKRSRFTVWTIIPAAALVLLLLVALMALGCVIYYTRKGASDRVSTRQVNANEISLREMKPKVKRRNSQLTTADISPPIHASIDVDKMRVGDDAIATAGSLCPVADSQEDEEDECIAAAPYIGKELHV